MTAAEKKLDTLLEHALIEKGCLCCGTTTASGHGWYPIKNPETGEERLLCAACYILIEEAITQLKRRLLNYGGGRFQVKESLAIELPPILITKLLSDGTRFQRPGRKVPGKPSQCHVNALNYARNHPKTRAFFGLALHEDGCWRVHSWAVGQRGGVFDSASGNRQYFGIDWRDVIPTLAPSGVQCAIDEDPNFPGLKVIVRKSSS